MNNDLTVERLHQALAYDENTGVFTWLIKASKNTVIGSVAGCVTKDMPVRIRLDGFLYRAHRLAWLYKYGNWPKKLIDHRNGCNVQNAIANLRDVSHSTNSQNIRKSHKDNATGFLGVSARNGKFVAQLTANGKAHFLGVFDTPEIAHAAYVSAKREMHEGNTL